MAVRITHPEVGEATITVGQHIARALAEGDHIGVRLEQQPLFEQRAPVVHHAAREFGAERFEPMRAAWTGKRDRLCDVQGIFHKINALQTGFEV